MVVGEYLHLVSIALVPSHIFAVVAFIVVGALCDRLFELSLTVVWENRRVFC